MKDLLMYIYHTSYLVLFLELALAIILAIIIIICFAKLLVHTLVKHMHIKKKTKKLVENLFDDWGEIIFSVLVTTPFICLIITKLSLQMIMSHVHNGILLPW